MSLKLVISSFCAVVFLGLSLHGQPARGLVGRRLPAERALRQGGESPYRLRVPLGLDEYVPIPEDNTLTSTKIELGKQLFFDKRLSYDRTIACASCHVPEKAFANESRVAIGTKGREGNRNVPSILNRAYGRAHFWDGRARSLEEQALDPIQNPIEMDLTLVELELRLRSDPKYKEDFQTVFGTSPTAENTARALASFVRTLLSGDSPFDRFVHGERQALSGSAQRGLQIFRGKGNCTTCHSGPLLSDEQFHNTGVGWREKPGDFGRYEVTKNDEDRGKFKTPSLRNVALTAPYMHNGSLTTLEEIIDFYSRGTNPNRYLDSEIRPLNLKPTEKADLLSFLMALTSSELFSSTRP